MDKPTSHKDVIKELPPSEPVKFDIRKILKYMNETSKIDSMTELILLLDDYYAARLRNLDSKIKEAESAIRSFIEAEKYEFTKGFNI